MKIAHIFNAVNKKPENNKKISSQEFKIGYWKKEINDYNPPKLEEIGDVDYLKRYYYSLVPSNEDLVSKYDEEKLNSILKKIGDEIIMISGDFWGIQKFIFNGITTSKAAKILRSRSALIQLITFALTKEIEELFEAETLLFGAGKFLILAKYEENYLEKINLLQKELDNYFLQNYFGENGFIIATTKTTKDSILSENSCDLDNLAKDNDLKKFNKFSLTKEENILIDIFKDAKKDDDICEFCSKRVKTHNIDDTKACGVCYNQIELGKQLTKKRYVTIFKSNKQESKDNIELIKLNDSYYYAIFEDSVTKKGYSFDIGSKEDYFDYPKWSLNAYVSKYENKEIIPFSEYLKEANKEDGKTISSGLMALKADIDLLGNTFRELYKQDFRKFNRLSREVEFFFSDYVTSLIAKKKNVYTVFAGGDDLFLIGEYKSIVELAKEIRKEFLEFSLNKATISMGLVMFKPSTPITFISNLADEAEKRAKIKRDSIDIFGIPMKFDEFLEIEKDFDEVVNYLVENDVETTTFYYRLIELCDMKTSLDKSLLNETIFNPRDALWQSKLNYLFRRNISKDKNDTKIFNKLQKLIEKGEKFKPSIFLKIYNNRDKSK